MLLLSRASSGCIRWFGCVVFIHLPRRPSGVRSIDKVMVVLALDCIYRGFCIVNGLGICVDKQVCQTGKRFPTE